MSRPSDDAFAGRKTRNRTSMTRRQRENGPMIIENVTFSRPKRVLTAFFPSSFLTRADQTGSNGSRVSASRNQLIPDFNDASVARGGDIIFRARLRFVSKPKSKSTKIKTEKKDRKSNNNVITTVIKVESDSGRYRFS